MNSYSKKDCNEKPIKPVKSYPTIVKCSTPTGSILLSDIFSGAEGMLSNGVPPKFDIACLNINLSCLERPYTALDISVGISTTIVAAMAMDSISSATMSFQVYKTNLCTPNAKPCPVGQNWLYTYTPQAGMMYSESKIVHFSVCDCDNFICNCEGCDCASKCYSYSLVVTVVTPMAVGLKVKIDNASIRAISTESDIECSKC